jgi:hypothetical protein
MPAVHARPAIDEDLGGEARGLIAYEAIRFSEARAQVRSAAG